MVHNVKGTLEVQENCDRDMSLIGCECEVIDDFEEGSVSAVVLAETRLKFVKQVVVRNVYLELIFHKSFEDFRGRCQNTDWPEFVNITGIRHFRDGCYIRNFPERGKVAGCETIIYYVSKKCK